MDNFEDKPIDREDLDNVSIVEGSELGNMFLVEIDGEIREFRNNAKNRLLFKHGLYDFLYSDGVSKKVISEENPYIAVKPLSDGDYRLWYDDKNVGVTVPPSKSKKLLEGISDLLDNNDRGRIMELYEDIISNQVRRSVINPLSVIYPQSELVTSQEGWIIRGIFKLTWEADVYLIGKDLSEGDYKRSGQGVVKTDSPVQFLTLSMDEKPERKTVNIGGEEYTLTDLEMEFITKVEYLLEFEENIDDPVYVEVLKRYIKGEIRKADKGSFTFRD